jgi:hypothetical protein
VENIVGFTKFEQVLLDQCELLRDIFHALQKVDGHDVHGMISYILMQQCRFVLRNYIYNMLIYNYIYI